MTRAEEELEARARLLRAMAHPTRLLILNLMLAGPRHGEELAAILRLAPATISHHLSQLAAAGLVRSRKDQYYQLYELEPGVLGRSLADVVELSRPALATEVAEDAYRSKVIAVFFRHGRLTRLPAQRKKRQIVLERIACTFEPDRAYPESEVNDLLRDFHEDVATLRRALVEHGLMTRQQGIYRRMAEETRT